MRDFNKQLKDEGVLVSTDGLALPDQAKVVRAGPNGEPITDGVFPESKEFLAGYWIVDVENEDLNDPPTSPWVVIAGFHAVSSQLGKRQFKRERSLWIAQGAVTRADSFSAARALHTRANSSSNTGSNTDAPLVVPARPCSSSISQSSPIRFAPSCKLLPLSA